jgi:hypothetical protein
LADLVAFISARKPASDAPSAPADKPNPKVANEATSTIDSHRLFPSMLWGIGESPGFL